MKRKYREIGWSIVATHGLLFSLLWWTLSNGNVKSWWIGVLALVFAVVASVVLLPPVPLVWRERLKFTPFFVRRSLQSGVDVA